MYDMTKLKKRYFSIKLTDGKVLNIEPPKMKVLKKILSMAEVEDTNELDQSDIDNLSEALSLALSKNKENYKISTDYIDENFDTTEIQDLLKNYFEWVESIQSSKN